MGVVQPVLLGACALGLAVVVVQVIRNVLASNIVDGVVAFAELAAIAQLVAGLIAVAGAPHDVSKVVYIGYLVGAVLVLPVAWLWAQTERSRSGLGVLLVGLVTVPFLVLRLHQIWPGHG